MQLDFIITKWAAWPALATANQTESDRLDSRLAHVPKMLKRRLSPLAKAVFCVASECLSEHHCVPIVFSSSHGELGKTFAMMEQLEAGEEISPTSFSLSVHNAIAGLLSIAYQNKLQSTVLAPGEEGMAAAFIEALGVLTEGSERVLLAFYDEPVVPFYPTEPYNISTEHRFALAMVLAKSGQGSPLQLRMLPNTGDDGEQPWQLPAFARFLSGAEDSLILKTPRHSWCWEKNAATD